MSWKDKIPRHDLIFEEEQPSTKAAPAKIAQPSPSLGQRVEIPADVASIGTSGIESPSEQPIYRGLYGHTKVDSGTPSLLKVQELSKPLESVITDKSLLMRAALAQAAAQGITKQQLDEDIKKLYGALDAERDRLTEKLTEARLDLVEHATEEANKLEAEINSKKDQLETMRTNIKTSTDSIAKKSAQVEQAVKRRRVELDQMEAEFAGIK